MLRRVLSISCWGSLMHASHAGDARSLLTRSTAAPW